MKTDFNNVRVEIQHGVAVLFMNNPPVNQLSEHFVLELVEAVSSGFQDSEVKAIVLTGTGKNFIAGADLKGVYKVKEKDVLLPGVVGFSGFLNQIEMGPKPVIAAINGNALGGGLEISMACHYRVAADGVQLGQPEVKVGLIPGAGGTQRLPRLIGLFNALEMMTVGDPIGAEQGLSRRLIDEVVDPENLVQAAVAAANKFISGEISLENRRTRNRNSRLPSAAELKAMANAAKFMAMSKAKGYLAPFKVIEGGLEILRAVKNVVAQNEGDRVGADKRVGDQKGLGDAGGFWLLAIINVQSPFPAVGQELPEAGQILRRGDETNLAHAVFNQGGQGIIDHRFVINWLQLFAGDQGEREEARTGPAGEYYSLHRFLFMGCLENQEWLGGNGGEGVVGACRERAARRALFRESSSASCRLRIFTPAARSLETSKMQWDWGALPPARAGSSDT